MYWFYLLLCNKQILKLPGLSSHFIFFNFMDQKSGKDLAGCLVFDSCSSCEVSGPGECTSKTGSSEVFGLFSSFSMQCQDNTILNGSFYRLGYLSITTSRYSDFLQCSLHLDTKVKSASPLNSENRIWHCAPCATLCWFRAVSI